MFAQRLALNGLFKAMNTRCLLGLCACIAVFSAIQPFVFAQDGQRREAPIRMGFVGLHGGVFDVLKTSEAALNVQLSYYSDACIRSPACTFTNLDIVFFQHIRTADKSRYEALLGAAYAANSKFTALSCSEIPARLFTREGPDCLLKDDKNVWRYYGLNKDNLRRMLLYAAVTYMGRSGPVEAPQTDLPPLIYHPDGNDAGWTNMTHFLAWAGARPALQKVHGRVLIVAHSLHLVYQQREVVDALVRAFEKAGYLSCCITDMTPGWEEREQAFHPQLVVHTCHGNESAELRRQLDVPHITSLYSKGAALTNYPFIPGRGLQSGELQHQIISQELKGTIEPLFVACTPSGGGGDEAVQPVAERVQHVVDRAAAHMRLQQLPAAQKKVAIIYYDRSMGKSELMRGTASGMFLNAPRSLMHVLKRMAEEGYALTALPASEEDLLARMKDHGRQVGVWSPENVQALAESGKAVLIPAETYRRWFEEKIPREQREKLIQQWGPPPGNFMVYRRGASTNIVIPRVDLGHVILLPQPLRGEAHTVSALHAQTHDVLTPPPHNYLATYFWLQESFQAHAMIHFGTHGSEFLLPGKPEALTAHDWCDQLMGAIPNITLWIINNVGESTPVRRRTYATLIDHLTPPLVTAELADEYKNLQADIQKWKVVEEGALKSEFEKTIRAQAGKLHLDKTLNIAEPLTEDAIAHIDRCLEEIANETTPISLHALGEKPKDEEVYPFLVYCGGKRLISEMQAMLSTNEASLRQSAIQTLKNKVTQKMTTREALSRSGIPSVQVSKELDALFNQLSGMYIDFQRTGDEIDNLMRALSGRFIQPGPANSPDRNPGAIPTGRNMFVVNPEEIPTEQSWVIGSKLIDEMLAAHLKKTNSCPRKVAFSLSSFSSYRDFGVIESQIFYLMGVRPRWDARRHVQEVEVIPRNRLGRPRIDVFLSARSYYRDQLPTRMKLIDDAIRLVADLDEPDNYVRQNSLVTEAALMQKGMAAARARTLARARMFGPPPGQNGSGWYYYLAEKTGEWNDRADLMRTYLEQSQYVYTDQCWGEPATEAYEQSIQGTEWVIRSWADSVSSPLSNKYMWFIDGSLAQAVKYLTGKEPTYYLADVRSSDKVQMIRAEDALARDFHVRLFNRKWIEGMMKEGYAGADQVAVHVSNMLGWEVMREGSITPEQWREVVNVYVRDSKHLNIRGWFQKENPHAFQNVTQTVLEAIRKGYWNASDEETRLLADAYNESVVRDGASNGLRGGNNHAFKDFLKKNASSAPASASALSPSAKVVPRVDGAANPAHQTTRVTGTRLVPVARVQPTHLLLPGVIMIGIMLIMIGFIKRKGAIDS